MARKRDRVFALSLALLFFFTAFGFSFYVIWQLVSQKSSTNSSNSSSTSQNSSSSSTACSDSPAPTEAAIAAPTAYQPSGTVSALQTTDLTKGTGKTVASGDCLIVKYYGSLASNGTVFDQNYTDATGFEFKIGAGQVIKGWDQGLLGMKVGGTRRLVIPASLGYGSQAQTDSAGAVTIPANSNLVFTVKLLQIK